MLVGLPPAQSERTGQLRLRTTQYRSTKRYGRKPPIPHLTAELWPDGMLEARSQEQARVGRQPPVPSAPAPTTSTPQGELVNPNTYGTKED